MADMEEAKKRYKQASSRLVICLLVIWFFVSCVLGVFFAQPLNAIKFPLAGFPFGFWIAQQGSIYVFILLILVYALKMDKLDKTLGEFDDGENEYDKTHPQKEDK